MPTDWNEVRREFPALENWTFLNTATFGQLPRRSVEAVARHFAHRDELACHDFVEWFDEADRVRTLAATLINAEPADIAFVPHAAEALSLLLGGLDWRPGDEVLSLAGEFPNNLYGPSLLAGKGVVFRETPWDRFYENLNARTRLVLLSTVNYTSGFRPPLEELAPRLREHGVLLYLDGTQSLGALRLNADEIQPDMLAAHAYKWLMAPNGIGFMYVSPWLRQKLEPCVVGWRSHKGWRNVDNLHHGVPEFSPDAEKYEGGMLAHSLVFAMGASLELIQEIGAERIEQRVRQLADLARGILRGLGARLLYDESPYFDSPVIAARFEGRDASALARSLYQRRVLVSARHGNLRVSTHFYNNEDDLESMRQALQDAL